MYSNDSFYEETGYTHTFTVIPLTSQTTFSGLPTTFPIRANQSNGLSKTSYALIHQICTVEASCFKVIGDDVWKQRIGQISKQDKQQIDERLRYFFGFPDAPSDDWLKKNASPELLKKIFGYLPEDQRDPALESLMDDLP